MPDFPKYQTIDFSTIPGGMDFYKMLMAQYKDGVPKNISDIYLKQGRGQIGSNLAQGEQDLKESLSGTGSGVPIDALVRGQSRLQSGANSAIGGLNDKLGLLNYEAMQQAFNNYTGLLNVASQDAGRRNEFNVQKTQYDNENEQSDFDFGAVAGAGVGAAGNVLSSGISKGATCFCYIELFGKDSNEFFYARNWSIKNTSKVSQSGYIKLSAFLIPLFRRFPKFKNWFKFKIAQTCLDQMKNENQLNVLLSFFISLCYGIGKITKLNNRDSKILKTVFTIAKQ